MANCILKGPIILLHYKAFGHAPCEISVACLDSRDSHICGLFTGCRTETRDLGVNGAAPCVRSCRAPRMGQTLRRHHIGCARGRFFLAFFFLGGGGGPHWCGPTGMTSPFFAEVL
jgi:hypothetical protein